MTSMVHKLWAFEHRIKWVPSISLEALELMLECAKRHPRLVRLLASRGVPVNIPLAHQQLLRQRPAIKMTIPLEVALIDGPVDTVAELLLLGADVNAVNIFSYPPRSPLAVAVACTKVPPHLPADLHKLGLLLTHPRFKMRPEDKVLVSSIGSPPVRELCRQAEQWQQRYSSARAAWLHSVVLHRVHKRVSKMAHSPSAGRLCLSRQG